MERNAHRLTLHSPAGKILLLTTPKFIDVDQLSALFFPGFHNNCHLSQPFTFP